MTLSDYLQSEQAREDVRLVVLKDADVLRHQGGGWWIIRTTLRAWTRLDVEGEEQKITAYYRPDGDRFVVTDLGEGVRALRLRTGARYIDILQKCRRTQRAEHFYGAFGQIYDATIGAGNWERGSGIGALFDASTEADHTNLPDAICRVMLASLRVAEVSP